MYIEQSIYTEQFCSKIIALRQFENSSALSRLWCIIYMVEDFHNKTWNHISMQSWISTQMVKSIWYGFAYTIPSETR